MIWVFCTLNLSSLSQVHIAHTTPPSAQHTTQSRRLVFKSRGTDSNRLFVSLSVFFFDAQHSGGAKDPMPHLTRALLHRRWNTFLSCRPISISEGIMFKDFLFLFFSSELFKVFHMDHLSVWFSFSFFFLRNPKKFNNS